ncbi:MAG: hypothetical protein WBD36_12700 [Bacteroidota bacterium]
MSIRRVTLPPVLLVLLALPQRSVSQELQVALDIEGRVELITPEMEEKLHLFTDVAGFKEARMFQVSDSVFVLEISYFAAEKNLKQRQTLTAEECGEFRRKVSEKLKVLPPEMVIDQSGRPKLLTGAVGLGLGFYGWAIPSVLEVNDGRVAVALYLATSGATYAIANSATRTSIVTESMATAYYYGATRGIVHGASLYGIFVGEEGSIRWALLAGMGGSVLEGMYSVRLAETYGTDIGTIEAVGLLGDLGIGFGLGSSYVVDAKTGTTAGLTLLGATGGLLVGYGLTSRDQFTSGDVDVLQTAAVVCGSIAFTALDILDVKQDKQYVTGSMVGLAVGVGIGQQLVSGKNFTSSQGTRIRLAASGGVILGLGIAQIASSDNQDRTLYLTLGTIGALAGFGLSYAILAPEASSGSLGDGWRMDVNPLGLAAVRGGVSLLNNPSFRPPIVTLQYKF